MGVKSVTSVAPPIVVDLAHSIVPRISTDGRIPMRICPHLRTVCQSSSSLPPWSRRILPLAGQAARDQFLSQRKSAMAASYRTYDEFWAFYLREHSKPQTRALHYIGSIASIVVLVWAVVTQSWWWLLAV